MSLSNTINYAVSGNFTFDSTLVTFSGSQAKLKDVNISQSLIGMTYTSSLNADFGSGILTATATGSPPITNGQLDLTGSGTRYVDYSATSNVSVQTGAIKFKYRPNYSGNPATSQVVWTVCKAAADLTYGIQFFQNTSGHWIYQIFDGSAAQVIAFDFGAWVPVSGTQYEFEINYDFTTGAHRLFINGSQQGTTATTVLARSGTIGLLRIGSNAAASVTSNFMVDSFLTFAAPQHTTAYTPGYTIPAYSTANPTALVNSGLLLDSLSSFTETSTLTGSDLVKYVLEINGVLKWWNGSAWATSNGTYAQANLATEINANALSLPVSSGVTMRVKAFLHSADGTTTPALTSVTFNYGFFALENAQPAQCYCFMWVENLLEAAVTSANLIAKCQKAFFNGGFLIVPPAVSVTADSTGYVQLLLPQGAAVDFQLEYTDPNDGKTKTVSFQTATLPSATSQDLTTLLVLK